MSYGHGTARVGGFLALLASLALWGAAFVPAEGKPSESHCPALPPASGDVVHVASVGELESAVESLRSGQTVLIEAGSYRLTRTLHLRGGVREVALRGARDERDAVVIRGRGMRNADYGAVPHGVLISDARDVVIADLTIADVYYHPIQIQGEQGARDVLLYNLHLIDAGEQFVKGSTAGPPGPYPDSGEVACSTFEYTDRARSDYTNAVDVLAGADWVVRDNIFRRIRAPIGELAGPTILFWRNAQRTIIERNLLIECDRGIALGLSTPDPALARDGDSTYDHQDGIVRNNMIYQPPDADTTDIGITANHARDFYVAHNTVIQNGTFPWGAIEYRFDVSTGEISNNLTDAPIWERDEASASLSGNLTSAMPEWFVDAPSGNLHLASAEVPAVDSARSLARVPRDYDGDRRPIGDAADVGADEYLSAEQSTATPTPAGVTPVPTPTADLAPRLYLPTSFVGR